MSQVPNVREWWACECGSHTFSMAFVEHLHPDDKCQRCGFPPIRLIRVTTFAEELSA